MTGRDVRRWTLMFGAVMSVEVSRARAGGSDSPAGEVQEMPMA